MHEAGIRPARDTVIQEGRVLHQHRASAERVRRRQDAVLVADEAAGADHEVAGLIAYAGAVAGAHCRIVEFDIVDRRAGIDHKVAFAIAQIVGRGEHRGAVDALNGERHVDHRSLVRVRRPGKHVDRVAALRRGDGGRQRDVGLPHADIQHGSRSRQSGRRQDQENSATSVSGWDASETLAPRRSDGAT